MSKNKLDGLFQQKLAGMAQAPSEEARAKFEKVLAQRHKKTVIWWQVAAAVAILGVSTVLWYGWQERQSTESQVAVSEESVIGDTANIIEEVVPITIDTENQQVALAEQAEAAHDAPEVIEKKQVPVKIQPSKPKTQQLTPGVIDKAQGMIAMDNGSKEEIVKEKITTDPVETDLKPIDITNVEIAALDATASEVASPVPTITITYIPTAPEAVVANVQTTEKEQEKPSFKSILQSASNVSLMAELRDAKDDFLSSPFSLRNKKVKN